MAEKRNGNNEKRSNVRANFVVNIDESAIDMPSAPAPQNSGQRGVYFASSPGARPQSGAAQPPQGQPVPKNNVPPPLAPAQKSSGESSATARSMLATMAVIVISALLAIWGIVCVNDILAFDKNDTPIEIYIPENSSTSEIIDILKDSGLIRQKWFCKLFYKIFHTDKDKETQEVIRPKYLNGVYYVESNEGLEGLLNTFKSIPATAKTVTVVFPEGFTTFQMFSRLEEMGVCRRDHLYNALNSVDFDYDFVDSIPTDSSGRLYLLEGYLFPAQYEFYEGEDANSVIRRMLNAFNQRWTSAYQKKADKLKMSMDDIITLASIIQKEAGDNGQMAGISYVIHNRLNNSAAWPSIGCDSTMEYITVFAKDRMLPAQMDAYAKLYNTNGNTAIKGLPPGPICSPGKDAIEAALNPESPDGKKYFYFMHNKNGEIFYALTQSEFDQLVLKIRTQDARS